MKKILSILFAFLLQTNSYKILKIYNIKDEEHSNKRIGHIAFDSLSLLRFKILFVL